MNKRELLWWMDQVQEKIGKVLNTEGLSALVLSVVQSASVITYRVQLTNPTKAQIDKMVQLGRAFEQEIGESPIRVYTASGCFVVEIPSPNPVTPHADSFLPHTQYPRICVGFDTEVEPVLINLLRFPSLMLVAPPRAGKTSAVRSIMYSLLKTHNVSHETISVIICAEKLTYWQVFAGKIGVVGVYSDFSDMESILQAISSQLSQKAKIGESFSPPVFVVVDDLLRVLAQTETMANSLAEIASTGGSVGVYLFLITQSAGSNAGTGGIKVEDNIAARIIYRTTSATAAARSTGSDASGVGDLTTRHGDALLVVGTEKKRITTGFVEDSDIASLPNATTASLFLSNLKPIEDTAQKVESVSVKVVSVESAPSLTLDRIAPPRALTDDEVRHLDRVVRHFNTIGEPLSNNRLLQMIFGGKNGKYGQYLRDALEQARGL